MRLSAAERLARDPKPTFVCVLRVDDGHDFVDMYLVHICRFRFQSGTSEFDKSKRYGKLVPPRFRFQLRLDRRFFGFNWD